MVETTLGEQILLLSLDDETGTGQLQAHVEAMQSSAVLMELVLRRRIGLEDGLVVPVDPSPIDEPALDEALAQIATSEPQPAKAWLLSLRDGAIGGALRGLLAKGIVGEERSRRWGIFTQRRHPQLDGTAEQELRARLAAVVLHGRDPDPRTAALVVLLHTGGLAALVSPDADPEVVERRMAAITAGPLAEPAVTEMAAELRAVIMAMLLAAVVIPGFT